MHLVQCIIIIIIVSQIKVNILCILQVTTYSCTDQYFYINNWLNMCEVKVLTHSDAPTEN